MLEKSFSDKGISKLKNELEIKISILENPIIREKF